MGVMGDGRAAFGGSGHRMGVGSGRPIPDKAATKHQRLHHQLQMASSTSIPVSGVALTAKTGQGDLYDSFRTARSIKYHVAAETRQKDLQHS